MVRVKMEMGFRHLVELGQRVVDAAAHPVHSAHFGVNLQGDIHQIIWLRFGRVFSDHALARNAAHFVRSALDVAIEHFPVVRLDAQHELTGLASFSVGVHHRLRDKLQVRLGELRVRLGLRECLESDAVSEFRVSCGVITSVNAN